MKISKANDEPDDMMDLKNLRIVFLGPSSVGKSTWAKAINKKYPDIEFVEIDANLGNNKRMAYLLRDLFGKDEVEKMGNFFGKPWESPSMYKQKESLYLEIEREEMENFRKEYSDKEGKFIADFTGSSIYCKEELEKCKGIGLYVYLEASKEQYEIMQENFLANPKPVIWGKELLSLWEDVLAKDGVDAINHLPELYSKLLDYRHKHYLKNADVVLSWQDHRENAKLEDPDTFLEIIRNKLALEKKMVK